MADNQLVETLSVRHQLGLLVKAVVGVAVLALLVLAYRHFTYKEPVTPPPLPEGIVEMTPSQLATLKVEAVGGGDGWQQTAATGMIAVDETHATPVFLPYSGQVTQVMAPRATSWKFSARVRAKSPGWRPAATSTDITPKPRSARPSAA